jgi:hypothetical protein
MRADIEKLLGSLDPTQALPEIAAMVKKILPLVTEEDRLNFVVSLIGGAGDDKVASMVHL